jgi:hypothetical protein
MIDAELISALTPIEFIIYAQIKLRAGGDGQCWESLQHMAEETSTSTGSLKRSIKGLLAKNLIKKEKRAGNTDLYSMTPPEEWILPRKIKQVDPCSVDHGDLGGGSLRSTEHGSQRSTNKIPFKLDPLIKDQDARASKFEPSPTQTLAAGDPFKSTNPEGESTPQATEPLNLPPSQLDRICISGEEKEAAACRTTIDNTGTATKPAWGERYDSRKANRAKAKANSFYNVGLKNNRWSDREDFKRFEIYAADWVKNHPELVLGGKNELDNPKGYLVNLLTNTARCVDEGSKDLVCWKNWQLEKQAFSPQFVAHEPVIVSTSAEESKARIQAAMEKFNAQRAANRAAQEAEDREYQENRWFPHAS